MEKKIKRERNSVTKTEIIRILEEHKSALAHKDFQHAFGDKCDRVTIYRALDRLVEEGKLHKVVNVDGVVQYAICHNCKDHHHHDHVHFNCTSCGKVSCIENIKPQFVLPAAYKIEEIQCVVSGTCPECNAITK
ncbi:Fur family transcriptional regulator [Flavobacterium sp. '19STA2R22 D10 B1']|uniref:Fur family transcriptional regulator n=1 Tax=Flavobacterium aerium TaxID=3037261 RepID=UPI00278C0F41|nr:transcriptional repressor [Flavobacterium sp. '19STA2R22 D10 B1']